MRLRDYGGGLLFPKAWSRDQYSPAEEEEQEQLQAAREERETAHLPDAPAPPSEADDV